VIEDALAGVQAAAAANMRYILDIFPSIRNYPCLVEAKQIFYHGLPDRMTCIRVYKTAMQLLKFLPI
jgi:beta-phosphoglucomutase-like phosphatase (HAD superfamily)